MDPEDKDLVVSYLTLRQMIGWAGLLLPFSVRLGAYLFEHIASTESISAYYYTGMRDVFVSTLVLVGALVACYRTPAILDTWLATIAGLAAIGIALFPMHPTYAREILDRFPGMASEQCYVNRGFLGYHFIFVGTFFLLSFVLVFFRFKAFTPDPPTPQKIVRNRIYQICGVAMVAAYVAIGLLFYVYPDGKAPIFWPETVAVIAFGAAWLVKGRIVLKEQ